MVDVILVRDGSVVPHFSFSECYICDLRELLPRRDRMIKIPRPPKSGFKLTISFTKRLRSIRLTNTSGEKVQLDDSAIEAIGIALTSLKSLDAMMSAESHPEITLAQRLTIDAEKIEKHDSHLRFISALFAELRDDQLYGLSIYLSMGSHGQRPQDPSPDLSSTTTHIDEICRTLKLLAANPGWFSDVVASIKMNPNRKQQDIWLYHTLDELCSILEKHDVIVTRNQDSEPFGLVMDSLRLVRPDITPAQVESYLKETRQGVGRSSFGRRWGEIEDDLPDAEIASSQPSDLDPGAGSDRHPSETT